MCHCRRQKVDTMLDVFYTIYWVVQWNYMSANISRLDKSIGLKFGANLKLYLAMTTNMRKVLLAIMQYPLGDGLTYHD